MQLYNRRKDMMRFHSRDLKLVDYIETLMQKYHCSRRALEQDFTRRHTWIPKLLLLEDSTALVNELMLQLAESRAAKWRIHEAASRDRDKLQALRLIDDSVYRQIEVLQSLGVVYHVPFKVEGSLETMAPGEAFHKLLREIFVDEPDGVRGLFEQP